MAPSVTNHESGQRDSAGSLNISAEDKGASKPTKTFRVHKVDEELQSSTKTICILFVVAVAVAATAVLWSDGVLGSTATLASVQISAEDVSFSTNACISTP